MTPHWPAVTCLCPTYGRFQLLRRAVACFLAQDYPGEKRLLVLNDGVQPIPASGPRLEEVFVVNHYPPFQNLGLKRQRLLECAGTPIVAHWDDDDLYLPWHLSEAVRTLESGLECTKVRRAWRMRLVDGRWAITGREFGGNDGSMVFNRETALALGGYPDAQVGQNIKLLHAFQEAGLYAPMDQHGIHGVVVRRTEGAHNVALKSAEAFRAANTDFGNGEPLTPADLRPMWDTIIRDTRPRMRPADHAELERRLSHD